MDPGAVLLGAARLGQPRLARMRSSTSTTRRSGPTPSPGPGRGAAVLRVKGTTKALVATTDGNAARRRARPVAGRRAGGRRGDPQRLDHRRAAAGRHELPQLRRPDAARGVLAADRGRARSRRRVPGARPARHRRQRLALQRVADGAIAPTAEIGVVGLLDDVATLVGPAFALAGDAIVLVGEAVPGLAGSAYADSPGPPPRTTRRRSTSPARRPSRRSSARRSRRGLVASAQDVSGGGLAVALAECAMWGGRGASVRIAGRRTRRPWTCSARARRGSVLSCRPRYAAALHAAGPPARPAGRDDRRRSAATGW